MGRPEIAVYVTVALTMFSSCLIGPTAGQTGEDAKALRKQLFVYNEYDKKVRASSNQTEPKVVDVSYYLLAINELDDAKEILQTTGQLVLNWTDDFLTWNPDDYGGMEVGHWPQDDVWKPGVNLINSYVGYATLGDPAMNVQVTPDGMVIWVISQVFRSTCSVDIKYYPYDVQTCELIFAALGYSQWEVELFGGEDGLSLEEYEKNALWDVTSTSVRIMQVDMQFEPTIVFSLTLRRKPLYVVLTIMTPVILLMLLNIFVFVLPADSGEKAGYAVTVFLAFAVFLTIISATLPQNAESVSVFSIYMLLQTVQSTVITLISVVLVRVAAISPDTPIPEILRYVSCTRRRPTNTNAVDVLYDTGVKSNVTTDESQIHRPGPGWNGKRECETNLNWKAVANRLNIICLVFFTTMAVLSTSVCLTIMSSSQ